MGPRVSLAFKVWQPAPDGASWEAITRAWYVLDALIELAHHQDMQEAA